VPPFWRDLMRLSCQLPKLHPTCRSGCLQDSEVAYVGIIPPILMGNRGFSGAGRGVGSGWRSGTRAGALVGGMRGLLSQKRSSEDRANGPWTANI